MKMNDDNAKSNTEWLAGLYLVGKGERFRGAHRGFAVMYEYVLYTYQTRYSKLYYKVAFHIVINQE